MPASQTARRATDERGQTLPIIVGFLLVLLLFCALVIDVGNAWRAREALQASTDAAATAAAGTLTMTYPPSNAGAVAQAAKYGDGASALNPVTGIVNGSATQNVSLSCKIWAHYTCTYDNTVDVTQSVKVPTYFLGLIGVPSITITTHAEACSPCGEVPLDIMLVMDRTGSMLQDQKEVDLKAGLNQGFLPGLDPTVDQVGLSVLPPNVTPNDTCRTSSSAGYAVSNPTYMIDPLEFGYLNPVTGGLIPSDPLVSDINCIRPGGQTDYADALQSAYNELENNGRKGVQKVIVLLSDGAANIGQSCRRGTTSPDCTQPCHDAVNLASAYKAAPNNILIYTILYGPTSDYGECQSWTGTRERPAITPQTAMQEIASPGNYYPDPNPANLTTIFQQISADMAAGTSRLVQ